MQHTIQRAITNCFPTIGNSYHLQTLTGGYSNAKVYKLDYQGQAYVVRQLASQHQAQNQREIQATRLAAQLGISPNLIYSDSNDNVLIMHYIEGKQLTKQDYTNTTVQHRIASIFRCLNDADIKDLALADNCYLQRIQQLINQLEFYNQRSKLAHWPAIKKKFKQYCAILQSEKRRCFSHGDPYNTNFIISDEKVYLIDWHDAGLNNLLLDLATFSYGLALSEIEQRQLLVAVVGEHINATDLEQFYAYYDLAILQQGLWAWLITLENNLGINFSAANPIEQLQAEYHQGLFDLRQLADYQRYAAVCVNYFLTATKLSHGKLL